MNDAKMNKEEFIRKIAGLTIEKDTHLIQTKAKYILQSMDEYANQQVKAERERCAKEIIKEIKMCKEIQCIGGDTPFNNEFVDALIEALKIKYLKQ